MNKADHNSIRLLLVDDEDGFRSTLARRLAKRGFAPSQAPDGEECLRRLARESMDVVVLDVNMPGMNGIETLKSVKQMNPDTQVILLTGNVAVFDGIEGIKSGAFDYLTKPVEIDHLVKKIKQAFDIRRLEQEKEEERRYRTRLEKKMIDTERLVALGTMSTGIAHEINNPLAIINESAGFMKQILSAPKMAGIAQKDLLFKGIEKIETSVKRARRITHQLMGYVKKEDIPFSEVDLKALLEETLGLLKKELNDKTATIRWDMDKHPNILWSDPYQIRQVLMNLLSNSIHALKPGGTITLSSDQGRSDLFLTIQDTGVGIPRENMGKIFDPFFTTKSFDQGTGLGLFVVHKILSNLKGDIDVESSPGKGTSFVIRLPKQVKKNGEPR